MENRNLQISQDCEASDQEIKKLLITIQNLTTQMSNTFEQAILKHEEQFIKTYRIKTTQLTKLFQDLTKVLEDKFINNALTNRLNIVLKQRDYFKYQCLKLNIQYQTILSQHNGLASQLQNLTDQMKIYKHLLEDEKIKNKQLEKSTEKFKSSFNQMAYKTLTNAMENIAPKTVDYQKVEKKNKKLQLTLKQIQQKNDQLRNLKMKISQLQFIIHEKQNLYFERKQLLQVFKSCVNSWKRDIITKDRMKVGNTQSEKRGIWNIERVTVAEKKQLLKYLFTSNQFLKFIEQLLFDPNLRVQFVQQSPEEMKVVNENRVKLFQYMKKKKLVHGKNF